MSELNDQVTDVIDDATVITVPIDDTLSVSGEAADAAAVGAALALKADASSVVEIDVNGQAPDTNGHIIIDGTDIQMGSGDSTTLKAAIDAASDALDALTAEDIPMSDSPGAQTVAEALEGIDDITAEDIPMSDAAGARTVAAQIGLTNTTVSQLSQTIAGINSKTGEDIQISSGSTQTVKAAVEERVLTVNGTGADENGNVQVEEVQFAANLQSNQTKVVDDEFIQRTAGGSASVESGDAWLGVVYGNTVHDGFVAESLTMTVTPMEREAGVDPITASIDRDTFVAYVSTSGTTVLTYSTAWSADPSLYGVTVSGTPVAGDIITIVYVKEVRGTITVAVPEEFVSTGWNLYDHTAGYARVSRYSDTYGFMIGGSYTALAFSETLDGEQTALTVSGGLFMVPGDGYVWVTGGDGTTTAIIATWEDWQSISDAGEWEAYTEYTVDLSEVMDEYFSGGLLAVGGIRDEIDLNTGYAISRIERLTYSDANRAAAEASGRAYEFDENYIYLERAAAVTNTISLFGGYTVHDHGMEFFTETEIPLPAMNIYGNNLRNKLERDVVTISQQTLETAQKAQVRTNLGLGAAATAAVANNLTTSASGSVLDARQGKAIKDQLGDLNVVDASVVSNGKTYTLENGVGYLIMAVSGAGTHQGMWMVAAFSSGSQVITIQAGSAITYSVDGLTITFTHASGRNTRYTLLKLAAFS